MKSTIRRRTLVFRGGLGFIVFLMAFIPTPATGSEDESWPVSILKFTGGLASSAFIHEGAHALTAWATGTDMTWEVGTYNQPIGFTDHASSKSKGVAIYSVGFIAQAIGGEVILQYDRIDKNDNFVRGMMTWDVVNPLLYSLDYWFFHRTNKKEGNSYQGDLQGIEHYSNQTTANVLAVSFSAIALFQGYRFLKTQEWAPDWLKGETTRLGFRPLHPGGLLMTCQFRF